MKAKIEREKRGFGLGKVEGVQYRRELRPFYVESNECRALSRSLCLSLTQTHTLAQELILYLSYTHTLYHI